MRTTAADPILNLEEEGDRFQGAAFRWWIGGQLAEMNKEEIDRHRRWGCGKFKNRHVYSYSGV
jgi:hypothetical protein